MGHAPPGLDVRLAAPSEAGLVHRLMLDAFAEYRRFAIPSSALTETLEDVASVLGGSPVPPGLVARARAPRLVGLRSSGAVLAFDEREAVASARFELRMADPGPGGALAFSRMAVSPRARRRGVGRALVAWLEELAGELGLERVVITVRSQQPDNRPYYARLGYRVTHYSGRYGIPDMVTHMEKRLAPPCGAPGVKGSFQGA